MADVVETLGIGLSQLITCMAAGGVWMADGAEVMIISSVTDVVSREWSLGQSSKSVIVSVVYTGVLMGNLLSGLTGDAIGRRLPVFISYGALGLLSVVSASAQTIFALAACRLLVGIAMGVGQPAAVSLITESSPSSWRLVVNGGAQCLFMVGEMWAIMWLWIDDPTLQNLNWRFLLCVGALPAFLWLLLSVFFLPESPFFLALVGNDAGATDVLKDIMHKNAVVGVDVSKFKVDPPEQVPVWKLFEQQARTVCGGSMIATTLVVSFGCFTVNFASYGGLYAFPQIIPEISFGCSPAGALFLGTLWEVIGCGMGNFAGAVMSRKASMFGGLVATAVSTLLFVAGGAVPKDQRGVLAFAGLYAGYFGIKCFVEAVFVILYQFASEAYPTTARSTGTACCLAAGRLGAISCSLVYEGLKYLTGSWQFFFLMVGGCCLLDGLALLAVVRETKDSPLRQRADETTRLADSMTKSV